MPLTCLLCESQRIFTLRTFRLAQLRREWSAQFGFDPFVDFPKAEPTLRQYQCAVCRLVFFLPHYVGGAQFYERLAQQPWYYDETRWEFGEALRRLGASPNIRTLLEIGCGEGFFLEKVEATYDVQGTEINAAAVQTCQRKGLRVASTPLHTLSQQFDAIVAFEVLEHLPEPRVFLQQAVERLVSGGALILAVPNPESYLMEFDHVLLNLPPHHSTWWSKYTFEHAARQFGLQWVGMAAEPLRYTHYRDYFWEKMTTSHPAPGRRSWLQRLQDKVRWMFTVPAANALMPLGYQYHKQVLLGQTHLVEFRKS